METSGRLSSLERETEVSRATLGGPEQVSSAVDHFWPSLKEDLFPGRVATRVEARGTHIELRGEARVNVMETAAEDDSATVNGYALDAERLFFATPFLDEHVEEQLREGPNDRLIAELAYAFEKDGSSPEVSLNRSMAGALSGASIQKLLDHMRAGMNRASRSQAWLVWRWAGLWAIALAAGTAAGSILTSGRMGAVLTFLVPAAFIAAMSVSAHVATKRIFEVSDEFGSTDPKPYAVRANRIAIVATVLIAALAYFTTTLLVTGTTMREFS